jgi:hypothetical protein
VNREHMNWLLQTIKDHLHAHRFCWLSTSEGESPINC